MASAPGRGQQFLLVALACVAVAAFGASYNQPIAWALCAPCLASAFWRIPRAPAAVVKWVRWLAWGVVTASIVLGLVFMAFPIILEPGTAARSILVVGCALAAFAALFALGTPLWLPSGSLIPCAIALLAVACFNSTAPIGGLIRTAGAILLLYLVYGTWAGPWKRLLQMGYAVHYGPPALATAVLAGVITWLLPLAQTGVEQITFQLFLSGGQSYAGFSTQSRLGDIERLKLSTAVVMRVWTDRPQHLRARVFTKFDGRAWEARPSPTTPLNPVPPETAAEAASADWLDRIPGTTFALPGVYPAQADERVTVRTRILQSAYNNVMVAPGQKLLVRAPLDRLKVDEWENLVTPLTTMVDAYGIVHRRTSGLVQPGPATDESLAEALALPADTDPRLREVARRLSEGADAPDDRVRRTVSYVEKECHYSLNVGKFRSSQPVAEFLFEKKKGYCQYFASAAAVLLRLQGVPARYVHGFNVSEGNRLGGHYVVRELDAHAWIEVYIPGGGWIELDPTPAAEYEALHANLRGGAAAAAWEWLRAMFAEVAALARRADWRGLLNWTWANLKTLLRALFTTLPGLALLLAAAAGIVLRRLRRARKATPAKKARPKRQEPFAEPSPELAELLARLDRVLAERGCPRPAACAPLEHLDAITSASVGKPLRAAARDVIECYYRSSFGGAAVTADRLPHLRDTLEAAVRVTA